MARPALSREMVADRAVELADTEGLEAVTVRRLATELGVTPMALYWHFRNKEELLAGLADRVWSELDTDVDDAEPWHRQLRGLLESLLQVLRSHPCASQLILEGEKQSSSMQLASEMTLEVLHRGGFGPEQAAEITRNALWTGLMLVMSEPGFHPELTAAEIAEKQRTNRVRMALLPPDQFPRLVEAAEPMSSCDPEFHYRFGVDLFIAGVRALAPQP